MTQVKVDDDFWPSVNAVLDLAPYRDILCKQVSFLYQTQQMTLIALHTTYLSFSPCSSSPHLTQVKFSTLPWYSL